MLFLINDYLLTATDRLKLLVWAPELATRVPGGELGAAFFITDSGGSTRELPSGAGIDLKVVMNANPTSALSAAELDLKVLGPGTIQTQARIGGRSIGNHEVVVLDAAAQNQVLQAIRDEKLRRRELVGNAAQQGTIWQASWERLFVYLDTPVPRHLGFRVETIDSAVKPVARDACEFVAFHIFRFLFSELFYGGNIVIGSAPTSDRPGTRLTVTSRGFTLARQLPGWLTGLVGSLTQDGVPVRLEWRPDDAKPQATLDVYWLAT